MATKKVLKPEDCIRFQNKDLKGKRNRTANRILKARLNRQIAKGKLPELE